MTDTRYLVELSEEQLDTLASGDVVSVSGDGREILDEHGVTFGSRDELLPATLREYDGVEVLDGGKQYRWRGGR